MFASFDHRNDKTNELLNWYSGGEAVNLLPKFSDFGLTCLYPRTGDHLERTH